MVGQTESYGHMKDAANDSTFPQFTRLPPELRRMIWLLAAQIPRTIEVSQESVFIYKLFRMYRMSKIITKFTGHITPAILSASQESRSTALEVYTKLHFNIYETNIRTPLSKQKTLYVNLNLDVLYLRNSPRLSNMKHVRSVYLTNYTPFRNLRLNTPWIDGNMEAWFDDAGVPNSAIPSDTYLLRSCIRSLLKQAWYFSSTVECVELIVGENQDTSVSMDIVREAVEELAEGYSPLIDLQFVQVPSSSFVEGSETPCSASTKFLLHFLRMNIQCYVVIIYSPSSIPSRSP
jgi:2EXR family